MALDLQVQTLKVREQKEICSLLKKLNQTTNVLIY